LATRPILARPRVGAHFLAELVPSFNSISPEQPKPLGQNTGQISLTYFTNPIWQGPIWPLFGFRPKPSQFSTQGVLGFGPSQFSKGQFSLAKFISFHNLSQFTGAFKPIRATPLFFSNRGRGQFKAKGKGFSQKVPHTRGGPLLNSRGVHSIKRPFKKGHQGQKANSLVSHIYWCPKNLPLTGNFLGSFLFNPTQIKFFPQGTSQGHWCENYFLFFLNI